MTLRTAIQALLRARALLLLLLALLVLCVLVRMS